MKFPDSVLKIVAAVSAKEGDLQRAVTAAEKQIRKLPEFDDLVAALVRHAIEALLQHDRTRTNGKIRAGGGHSEPKVVTGASRSVQSAYSGMYAYRIGGTMLGLLTGEQLRAIGDAESAAASGHTFNARLMYALDKIVSAKKRVHNAVSAKKLDAIAAQIWEEIEGAKPDAA